MALSKQDPRLAFYCEQDDHISRLVRRYVLLFYYEDRSIEMRELPKNVPHLKRTPFPHLKKDDFTLGAVLTIFGGIVTLTAYADEVTRELCEKKSESTVVLFGEAQLPQVGHYLAILTEECGFTISSLQMAWVEADAPARFGLPEDLVGGRVVVAKCARNDAIEKGLDYVKRATGARAASNDEEAKAWSQILLQASRNPVAVFGDYRCSVVLVKPHALRVQAGGSIIQRFIDAGLEMTAFVLAELSSRVVDEFLQPYKGVLPDFGATSHAMAGPVWIVQFVSLDDDVDVVSLTREICGPFDPAIARAIRPKSIRAVFGVDRAQNAVHCCDLPEEGPLYTDFFFKPRDVENE
ncbi:putative nucleoside diphosphate kinase [Trypanosoma grayi]|uniref:putative nucleoside diphosphate kinase n=1 Tax=Trypanosoma grayi TaxID=71804 RepID=UPI0004F42FB5|nr:putative nucleoside diphosphate kinase [Trypanosoma grayi]KEG14153.1 putative nucleoside diphosphate kinase [Trypanosoma grayi]